MRFIPQHPGFQWTWKIAVSKRAWPSERTRHANHPGPSPSVQQKITPHIPWKFFGLPFSNFPPYFSKVADLRFNPFLDTYGTIRQCCRSPRPLQMLPIDYPSNSTPDGTFAPIFAKDLPRKSKNPKNPKNIFGHYLNPSRKKKRDLNRISLTLSNRRSLISVCSLTFSNRFLLRPSAPDMRITPNLHHLSSKKTLRTFHGKFSVSHFPISLHICSK